MRRVALGFTLVLLLALPGTAIAGHQGHHDGGKGCTNSAICQYVENVPGGGGSQPTQPPANGGGGGGGGTTNGGGGGGPQAPSPGTEKALAAAGPAGAGAASLANSTATRSFDKAGGSSAGEPTSTQTGGSPKIGTAFGHVVGAWDAGPGMGLALPIVMALSLAAAILIAIRRHRLAHPTSAP